MKSNKENIFFLPVLILFTTLLFADTSLYCQFSGGNGSQNNPYRITSKKDMETLADSVNKDVNWSKNKYFVLLNDITDSVRTVIGKATYYNAYYTSYNSSFEGNFDGRNHKITIAIDGNKIFREFWYIGLFGVILGGSVRNVVVDGYIINSYSASGTGGIAGRVIGTERNVSVIDNCVNLATVKTGVCGGGIVGVIADSAYTTANQEYYTIIKNCTNVGNIKDMASRCGGICGISMAGAIINCVNYGFIEAEAEVGSMWLGGIVGNNIHGVVIECVNAGSISAGLWVSRTIGCITSSEYNGRNTGRVINCHYDKQMCTYGGIGHSED